MCSQDRNRYTCACVLSHFSRVWLFATPWTVAHQAPLSMGLSWQEYWSGLPFPPPGDLPGPGIEPMALHWQADSFITSTPWEAATDTHSDSLIMSSRLRSLHLWASVSSSVKHRALGLMIPWGHLNYPMICFPLTRVRPCPCNFLPCFPPPQPLLAF